MVKPLLAALLALWCGAAHAWTVNNSGGCYAGVPQNTVCSFSITVASNGDLVTVVTSGYYGASGQSGSGWSISGTPTVGSTNCSDAATTGSGTGVAAVSIISCPNVSAGSQTVSVSGSVGLYNFAIFARDWSGAALSSPAYAAANTDDGNAGNQTGTQSIATSASVNAGDLVYSKIVTYYLGTPSPNQTYPGDVGGNGVNDEYQVATSTTTYTNSWGTSGTGYADMNIVAFHALTVGCLSGSMALTGVGC